MPLSFNRFISLKKSVFQHEEHGQNAHSDVQFLPATSQNPYRNIGDETQEYSVGNAVSERHNGDAHEARNSIGIIRKVHLSDIVHHHNANEEQSRSRCLGRYGKENRSKEQGKGKAYSC